MEKVKLKNGLEQEKNVHVHVAEKCLDAGWTYASDKEAKKVEAFKAKESEK